MEAAVVPFLSRSVPLVAILAFASCGGEFLEPSRCLARYSTYIHFQFDEEVGLPYTVDIETGEGSVSLVCADYPAEDPHGGAVVTESSIDRLEVGSVGAMCTSDRLSLIRAEETQDVTFEVLGSSRTGLGSGTPIYRLRQESCQDVLDGEILVKTQPIDSI
jgi:hypothetical protein